VWQAFVAGLHPVDFAAFDPGPATAAPPDPAGSRASVRQNRAAPACALALFGRHSRTQECLLLGEEPKS